MAQTETSSARNADQPLLLDLLLERKVLEEKDLPAWARGKPLRTIPNAPTTVDLHTRYFGTVTVTHAKHLARHISCKRCHGTGPVGELHPLEPKVAHDRCRGCHVEQQRGPTDCRGCHSLPSAAPEAPAPAGEAVVAAAGPEVVPAALHRTAGAQTPDDYREIEAALDKTGAHSPVVRRLLELGVAAGDGFGPAVAVTARRQKLALGLSFDRLSSGESRRTSALAGVGITGPMGNRLDWTALGLAGCDIVARPSAGVLPAIGARVGVEYSPRGLGPFHTLHLSLTGRVDLMRGSAFGQEFGGSEIFATFSTGLEFGK